MVEVFEMLQRELRQDPASEGMRPSPPDSSQVRKELMAKLGAVPGALFLRRQGS